ncbi:MAG: nucleotidyltransferase domain-containing protein [Chloroflexota bacterium]
MQTLTLHNSTENPEVDRILQEIIHLYETEFPEYIRVYYVIGSYADGSSISLSDIDLAIIFAKGLTREQLEHAWALAEQCSSFSEIRLDIGLDLEKRLPGVGRVLFKLGGLCVYGTDIRDQLELPPLAEYQQDVTWSPYRFLGQVIRNQEVLTYPLGYPDPDDPFYGYTQKRIDAWYPATTTAGTKEIITGVTRTATALLALRAECYVGTKKASVDLYRRQIGDEWSDFLETWYRKGKLEWYYTIPAQAEDQDLLRDLCQQTLAFENHYFQHYRDYLEKLLSGSEEEKLFAVQRLTQVCYRDEEMVSTLQEIVQSLTVSAEIRDVATQALICSEHNMNRE